MHGPCQEAACAEHTQQRCSSVDPQTNIFPSKARLQAIDDDNDSDADNKRAAANSAADPAANPAANRVHVARPTLSSNLHLSHGLDPFEVPPLEDLTDERLEECLKSAFGYGGFRGQQLQVVRRVLEGTSTLAVLPTGMSSSIA